VSEQHKMTAEERIQLDDRVRRLEWTDRLAYYGLVALMEEHAKAAVAELERKLSETYASRSALDCQYAGAHGESDGASHCPPEKPCQRCLLERERDDARAALTAAHALLLRLIDANGEQNYGIVAAARKLLGMPESRLNPDPDCEHYHE
jgi:hypothetical protein